MLFREGEQLTGIYFILEGSMKVHKHWGDDKELIVRFARNGQIVGHRGLGNDNLYPVSATALEKTSLCFLEKDFFDASLKVNQELLFNLMIFFANELKESERNMRDLMHLPVKNRIARALLSLKQHFGADADNAIDFPISRQDLASYVGTSYETLFRMMTEMTDEGSLTILDKKRLLINEEKLKLLVS